MKTLFFVYIIQSKKEDCFYIGQCDDLDRRVSKHNEGFSKYTATKRPCKLVYFECYYSRSESLIREKEIKRKNQENIFSFSSAKNKLIGVEWLKESRMLSGECVQAAVSYR